MRRQSGDSEPRDGMSRDEAKLSLESRGRIEGRNGILKKFFGKADMPTLSKNAKKIILDGEDNLLCFTEEDVLNESC